MSEATTTKDGFTYVADEIAFAPTPVVITQLTGKKRRLSLGGRALPYRGLGLGVSQRHNKHTPNGSTEGTLQVLGPEYDDATMEGCWKQPHFASGSAVVTVDGTPIRNVRQMEQVLHDMVKEGQLVEVTWDTHSRRGLIKHLDPKWDRGEICHWTLEFTWIGTGNVAKMPIQRSINPAKSVSWLDSLFADIDAFLDLVDDVEQTFLNGLRKAAAFKEQMFGVLERGAKLLLTPIQIAANLIQLATSMIAELRNFLTEFPRRALNALDKVVTACLGFPDAFSNWGIQGAGGSKPGGSSAINTGAGTQQDRDQQSATGHPPKTTPSSGGKAPISFTPVQLNLPMLPIFQTVDLPTGSGGSGAPGTSGGAGSGGASGGSGGASGSNGATPTPTQTLPQGGIPTDGSVPGPSAPPGAGGVPGTFWTDTPQPYEPQTQGAGSIRSATGLAKVTQIETLQRRLAVTVRRLLYEAVEFRQQLEQFSRRAYDLEAIWVCGQHDDLRRIAEKVYGDFRGWRDIVVYNRLETSACTPGQVVFVPRRNARLSTP